MLSQDPDHWPSQTAQTQNPLADDKTQSLVLGSTETPSRLIESPTLSSYLKLPRFTACVLRFLRQALQRRRSPGELDNPETKKERTYWIGEVQRDSFGPDLHALQMDYPLPRESMVVCFNPFLDEGFLRIGGRLRFADLSRKQLHHILLHGSYLFTALLIMETYIRLHHLGVLIVLSELREEF